MKRVKEGAQRSKTHQHEDKDERERRAVEEAYSKYQERLLACARAVVREVAHELLQEQAHPPTP